MRLETALTWSALNVLTKQRYDVLKEAYENLDDALRHLDSGLLRRIGCEIETVNKSIKLLKRFDKKTFSSTEVKKKWLKEVKQKFRDYVRELENERRREKKNLTQRKLKGAKKVFDKLLAQKALFPKKAQERLKMIKNNWKYFTAFYEVKDCPATNNAIENFYSTSLKTHRKKQLRTNRGIENHMKLTAFKRVEGFKEPKKTLIEIFSLIRLVTT